MNFFQYSLIHDLELNVETSKEGKLCYAASSNKQTKNTSELFV